jgi:hypothetical protein
MVLMMNQVAQAPCGYLPSLVVATFVLSQISRIACVLDHYGNNDDNSNNQTASTILSFNGAVEVSPRKRQKWKPGKS